MGYNLLPKANTKEKKTYPKTHVVVITFHTTDHVEAHGTVGTTLQAGR